MLKLRKKKSLSLIEVLAALLLFAILVGMVATVMVYAFRAHKKNMTKLEALNYAKTVTEYLRSLDYDDDALNFEVVPGGCSLSGNRPIMTCPLSVIWDSLSDEFRNNYSEFKQKYAVGGLGITYKVIGEDARYNSGTGRWELYSDDDSDTYAVKRINVEMTWELPSQ